MLWRLMVRGRGWSAQDTLTEDYGMASKQGLHEQSMRGILIAHDWYRPHPAPCVVHTREKTG